jgi:hypothetical protein
MRLELGSVVPLHCHTSEVHAFNLSGTREILGTVAGVIEYLGDDGQVTETVSSATQRGIYLAWCQEHGVRPSEQILADARKRCVSPD